MDIESIIQRRARVYQPITPISARIVKINGRRAIQACSTQYLGILWNKDALRRIGYATDRSPFAYWGSLGSNYLGGSHKERIRVEELIAKKAGYDGGLAFASGWAANFSVVEAMSKICDLLVIDRRCHNSILMGLRCVKCKFCTIDFDTELSMLLSENEHLRIGLICVSIEGLTGEKVDPSDNIGSRSNIIFALDECHSFGTQGKQGFDSTTKLKPYIRILGLSKAIGSMGAVVCSDQSFIELLSQVSSPWIFSTSVPPIIWRINYELVKLMPQLSEERRRIQDFGILLREGLVEHNIQHLGSTHITGIKFPRQIDAVTIENNLLDMGFYLKVSEFPSRPKNEPIMRVAFNPYHKHEDVGSLVQAIKKFLK